MDDDVSNESDVPFADEVSGSKFVIFFTPTIKDQRIIHNLGLILTTKKSEMFSEFWPNF